MEIRHPNEESIAPKQCSSGGTCQYEIFAAVQKGNIYIWLPDGVTIKTPTDS